MARKPTSKPASRDAIAAEPGARRLAGDDAALWERIARSATPLVRGKNRLSRTDSPAASGPAAPPTPPVSPSGPAAGRGAARPPPSSPPTPPRDSQPRNPAPGQYDRREARRLAAGRAPIDARIDLHGMRQREAYRALNAFLATAHARGHRHVLVITGKGRSHAASPAGVTDEKAEPGVLKRALPQWLESEGLRAIVVGYAQAGPRHGGGGAFYIRLRKPGR